jgi:hypothetical protein
VVRIAAVSAARAAACLALLLVGAAARANEPAGPALTGGSPKALVGDQACVCGRFPTAESVRALSISGLPLAERVVASTGSSVTFTVPDELAPGGYVVQGDAAAGYAENDRVEGVAVRLDGAIDQEKLWRGEATAMRLVVLGTAEPVSIELVNATPGIVSLEGGERQVATSTGGARNEIVRRVRGLKRGDFEISWHLRFADCPCAETAAESMSLERAVAEGRVALRAVTEAATGDGRVTLELVPSAGTPLVVEIPAGTVLEATDPAASLVVGEGTSCPLSGTPGQVDVPVHRLAPPRGDPPVPLVSWTVRSAESDPRYARAKRVIEAGAAVADRYSCPEEHRGRVVETSIWVAEDPAGFTRDDLRLLLVAEAPHDQSPPAPEELAELTDQIWNDVDLTVKASRQGA